MNRRARCALALFARPVVAGATKTRLAPRLGGAGAAQLYAAFLRDTLATLARVPELDVTLWVAGDPEHESLAECRVPRCRQPDGDLGARMGAALAAGAALHGRAIALGSDLPSLPADYLVAAASALNDHDVVLGPASDGGYYLIGVRCADGARIPALFQGVRWSSPQTLADTLALTTRAGLRVAMLPPWYDVDEPADLELLRMHLALQPDVAPVTADALTALGLAGAAFDRARWGLIRSNTSARRRDRVPGSHAQDHEASELRWISRS